MTPPRAVTCAGLAGLLAGLVLGWRLWHGRPPAPELIARIDTVLAAGPAVHDTLRVVVRTGAAAGARADTALARADSLAAVAARLGQVADSLATVAGDSAYALVVRTQERDRLREQLVEVRAANRSLAEQRTLYFQGLQTAERRIRRLEDNLQAASDELGRAARPPAWTAGPLWEAGRLAPVGGYVARELGPFRVQLEATDGPGEPATLRLGFGIRG